MPPYASRQLLSKSDCVERGIDRFSFGFEPQRLAGDIELVLINM